ncbi:ERF family protein [Cytobacillus sp. IB215665]|uniref:ERF family protein n=1 Tax=Cytobacillus sp. IB215665 TaxID=3097357 RepID=UPI002A0BF73B|nr:ERF family protein [Cytobacillus sp. IB215665]MDX8367896.1 ERF family protein [Cytobacillus sp. IB215665]
MGQQLKERSNLNLHQKLVEVRKSVTYLKKEATGHQFNYVSSSQVLGAIRQKLDELGVLLITEIVDKRLVERETTTNKGKAVITYEISLDLRMTWVNADNPEDRIQIPFFSMGLDTGDNSKAVGKSLTYGEKFFLLKQFNIATDKDDPDAFQERAENYVREEASTDNTNEFLAMADKFADLRNQDRKAVLEALKIKDATKLTKGQIAKHMKTLEAWIEKAKNKAS